jgi:tRNA(Ile)-lysidine synthase
LSDKSTALLKLEFRRALGDILTRVSSCAKPCRPVTSIALAYSGGLDSSALLQLAHDYAQEAGITLFAFHIHHGLSVNADTWAQHCEAQCAALGIQFEARRIDLAGMQKSGTEEAARNGRYAALGALCAQHEVPLLLTAHHEDDQAETVFLQLLRGSGVAGLSGMDMSNAAPDLLAHPTLIMGRPLLGVARAQLDAFVAAQQIAYVDDESNTDPRFARNALRHQVMPVIAALFPGYAQRFARTAQHAQSAQRLLIDLAAQDLVDCLDGDCIVLERLRLLGSERIDNLLRYWFGSRRMRMPSTAWLSEMRSQLLEAKADAQLCVSHPDGHIRRHRDRVYLTPKQTIDPEMVDPEPFRWEGQGAIAFSQFGGTLHFEPAAHGLPVDWLRAQQLELRYRSGGERLKLAPNRPTKNLKHLCQALDIPAWERETLIIVATAKQALYASGIGMDCHHALDDSGGHIIFRWQPDAV